MQGITTQQYLNKMRENVLANVCVKWPNNPKLTFAYLTIDSATTNIH